MTGADHEHSDAVVVAAQWLADERNVPTPLVPHLKQRFGLSSLQACESIAMAKRFRANRSH